MKLKILLFIFLTLSLLGNGVLFVYIATQKETISIIPRLENELRIIANLLPNNIDKSNIQTTLQEKGFYLKNGGEYYYAQKPNITLSIDSTYFVFSPSGSLIQINSLSDSLNPIYEKP